jgi:DNA adenine methylase
LTKIIEIFSEHTTYVEAFAGGAQVLFHKEPSKVEVLNDLDGDVVNFFRVCQLHYEELSRYLKFVLISRKWFALFEAENAATLTDIQRAARFFYLQKNAFAGLVRNRRYHCAIGGPPSFNPARVPELIENTHRFAHSGQISSPLASFRS